MLVASLKEAFAFVQRLNAAQPGFYAVVERHGLRPGDPESGHRRIDFRGGPMNLPAALAKRREALGNVLLLARCRWHWQRWRAALGRGGLLALATAIVLAVHGAFVLWPEQGELRRQRIALIAQLQACHTPASAPAAAMEQVRAQLRMALDQRKFAVMEQLGGAGLLLIDIRYRGEDAVRGSLRRTSMDVSAVGSYRT